MILPSVVRSGRTPASAWAPPGDARNEITSSKISSAPDRSQIARSWPRTSGVAARTPPAPWIGSITIAARSAVRPASARSMPSGSSHGSVTTSSPTAAGTPGEPATTVSWVP